MAFPLVVEGIEDDVALVGDRDIACIDTGDGLCPVFLNLVVVETYFPFGFLGYAFGNGDPSP